MFELEEQCEPTEAVSYTHLDVYKRQGETPSAVRDRLFNQLVAGKIDIVLTTPEFLSIHRDRFAVSRRVGFVVVDEAHHMAGAKGGDRAAYLDFPAILDQLGAPRVLAATATASTDVATEICRLARIDNVVVDAAIRDNLDLDDERDLSSRCLLYTSRCV